MDPMEKIVQSALNSRCLDYVKETDTAERLDFYLPDHDVFIEVKQFHTPRIAEQMSRAKNVIAVQGVGAVRFFAEILARNKNLSTPASLTSQHKEGV